MKYSGMRYKTFKTINNVTPNKIFLNLVNGRHSSKKTINPAIVTQMAKTGIQPRCKIPPSSNVVFINVTSKDPVLAMEEIMKYSIINKTGMNMKNPADKARSTTFLKKLPFTRVLSGSKAINNEAKPVMKILTKDMTVG